LSSSTAKRVVLYRFDRLPVEGIVNPAAFLLKDSVELITLDGTLQSIPYSDFKALCFVSESVAPDLFSEHNFFERRPKVPGLWTRFVFRDGDRLDGILSHNLLDWPEPGFFITPPRASAHRQRVFIPRAALAGTELRGVVGTSAGASPARRKAKPAGTEDQLSMFE
jgi:hypothetical protein